MDEELERMQRGEGGSSVEAEKARIKKQREAEMAQMHAEAGEKKVRRV